MSGGISFDRVAALYDGTRGLPAGVERDVADRLAERTDGARTLEVGVGTARWALPLQSRGLEVVGVDLSGPMLRVARAKGFSRPIRGDLTRLPFPDGRFDSCLATHVLHLVFDVPAALREIARVSRRRLRTVLEYETARPDLVEAYLAIVRAEGSGVPPPGLGERKLAAALRPDWVRDVARFHARGPAALKINAIRARAFRDTWATPSELHERAVRALRESYGEGEELVETRIEIAEWDRSRLLAFADEYAAAHPPAQSLESRRAPAERDLAQG